MKVPIYKDGRLAGDFEVPASVANSAKEVADWMAANSVTQLFGLTSWVESQLDIRDLQRRLAEREAELAALVHPFDLEKYRSKE